MTDISDFLAAHWQRVTVEAGLDADAAQVTLNDVLQRYSEPRRHYHDTQHLADCLRVADGLAGEAEDDVAVRLVLWFHDVIYDPQAADNEQQSAAYAARQLAALGAAYDLIDETRRLIEATQHHHANPGDLNAFVVLDADLAILGQSPQQYDAYAAAIRQEYVWVPEDVYREKRADVLATFLARSRIYYTRVLYNQLEAQARRNIQREIESLSAH